MNGETADVANTVTDVVTAAADAAAGNLAGAAENLVAAAESPEGQAVVKLAEEEAPKVEGDVITGLDKLKADLRDGLIKAEAADNDDAAVAHAGLLGYLEQGWEHLSDEVKAFFTRK